MSCDPVSPAGATMTEISEAELLAAARTGTALSGTAPGGAAPDDPADGQRRTVDAALLRRCCLDLAGEIDPRGLRLAAVHVTGQLDLAGITVPFPLRFEDCAFDTAPVLLAADLLDLTVTGCELPGLIANGLRLRRDLDLSRSRIAGSHRTSASITRRAAVWLSESAVGGRLICTDTSIDGAGDRALQADRIRIGGTARMIGTFTALGEVRMIGAHIDGALELTGAHLGTGTGLALDLEGAVIGGSLLMGLDPSGRNPEVRGRMDLGSASISGTLILQHAIIGEDPPGQPHNGYKPAPPGTAIRAPRLTVGGQFTLERDCTITGGIDVSMGALGSVLIGPRCVIRSPGRTAFSLASARVASDVRLDPDATVAGTLRLGGAVVHGALALHGSLSDPEHLAVIGGSAITVDGSVFLGDLRADGGRVNFTGATLGSLTAPNAMLRNPDGDTLSLSGATVGGSVRLVDGFTSTGTVVLTRARIGGRLLLSGGSFTCPSAGGGYQHGCAIEAISATIDGGLDLGWKTAAPAVDFTETKTSFLADDPARWPSRYAISGLTYTRFELPQGGPPRAVWDEAARSAWLDGQPVFDSGPYEQAAKVFREHGYIRGAEQILIAQRRQARRASRTTSSWLRRLPGAAYAAVGYGYRPWRVLWLIAALLVLVTLTLTVPAGRATMRASDGNGDVYSTAGLVLTPAGPVSPALTAHRSCGDGDVRCLSPELYAVDTVVPLISLDQRATWYPDPHVRYGEAMVWWLDLATILGWLLSSVFVLSLARLSRAG
jgi:hypothetical protein